MQGIYFADICRQLHLSGTDYLIDDAVPAYVQAQNPTVLEFLSRCAPAMVQQWQNNVIGLS